MNWTYFIVAAVVLYFAYMYLVPSSMKPDISLRSPWYKPVPVPVEAPQPPLTLPLDTQFVPGDGSLMVIEEFEDDSALPRAEKIRKKDVSISTAGAGDIRETVPMPYRVPVPSGMQPHGIGGSGMMFAPYKTVMTHSSTGYGYAPVQPSSKAPGCLMSEWTQWGPCIDGKSQRTRTYIHGAAASNSCAHTVEEKDCVA